MQVERYPYRIRLFLRSIFLRKKVETELDDELQFHLEQRIQAAVAKGANPDEARYAALRAFDGPAQRKEECRDMRRTQFFEQFLQDIRYASRSLLKNPGFALVALLSLALGIGANTAIFSLIDKLLLESLPVERPRELVMLNPTGVRHGWTSGDTTWTYPVYKALRDKQDVFTGLLAERTDSVNFAIDGATQRATESIVSGNYFEVLGVRALLGRVLNSNDDRVRGAHPVAVISHGFWVERLGSRPDILGQTIQLNRNPFTVVGVSEKGFNGLEIGGSIDIFVPTAMMKQATTYDALDQRTAFIFQLYGRLKPGITRDQARARLQPLYLSELEQDIALLGSRAPRGDEWRQGRVLLEDGHRGTSGLRAALETPLSALMAMTGVVLLIACVNIAGLLMARSAARTREISIRLAIGASRGRIIRQMLTESAVLTTLGSIAGILVATWTIRLLIAEMGESAVRLQLVTNFLDARVLGFAFAASLVTGILFGLLPAITASRESVSPGLKQGAGASRSHHTSLRKGLVTAQVAMGLVLVVASCLFLRTLENLRHSDTGFRTDHLVTFRLSSGTAGYDRTRSIALFQQIAAELRALPGVTSASISVVPMLSNSMIGFGLGIEGYTPPARENISASANAVDPAYFQMLGIPLLRGRYFNDSDTALSHRVAIVNEAFVKRYLPNKEPIGQRINFDYGRAPRLTHEIIGVVKDTRMGNLREPQRRYFFMPYTQFDVLSYTSFYVRTNTNPESLAAPIRQLVKRHDADIPVVAYRTLDNQIDRLLRPERLVASLSMAFALLATGLAAIGLYGVTAFSVARRTREIGIRMALGAQRSSVLHLVLREVIVMAAIGIATGAALSLLLSRYVESQLYGVRPRDFITLAIAAAVLAAVALASGWLPARRATRVDPILALRQD